MKPREVPRIGTEKFDHVLRYMVPSNHPEKHAAPDAGYLVELDAYNGNGGCCCRHFNCRLEPLLKRHFTAQEAVRRQLVKLKKGWQVADALRCEHIMTARGHFCDGVIAAIVQQETKK